MKPLNERLLNKIEAFLSEKEGCRLIATEITAFGATVQLQDAFGFVYEVQVKSVGRVEAKQEESILGQNTLIKRLL